MKELLSQVKDILWKSKPIRNLNSETSVFFKSQGNMVTSVDYEMEQYLIQSLHQLLPEAGIISEESDPHKKDINWVIDPIDGTGNLVNGFPFAVSVALVDNGGNALLGAVLDVNREQLFYAMPGGGAFVQACGNAPKELHVKKHPQTEGICIFGMPYDRNKAHRILAVAEKLYTISSDLKRIGPSALDICAVAEGRAKIYAELDLNTWDYSAAGLILKEAGGNIFQEGDLMLFCESSEVMLLSQAILSADSR